jgi:cytochrome P450
MTEGTIAAYAESVTVGELEADPYPVYARLRREAPACFIPAVGLWFVTRYDDVEYVVTHPAQFTAEMADSPVDRTFGSPTIITADGERHQDLRRGLDSKYRPRQVSGYIEDLVRPIAEPISVLSLGQVLGIDELGEDTLRDWFWRLHQGVINFEGDAERERIGSACSREIDGVLAPVFDRLEAAGDDSTISHLLHSGIPAGVPGGNCRARDYVMPTLKVILLGGMQEPGHGGGSTLAALLTDRPQLEAVRDAPELLPAAVDEGLRWMSPIGTQTRQAVGDVEIGGAVIPDGAPVGALVSAANRDETRFADPDRFDIFRPRQVSLAFGGGRHFCAGHAFSRAQIRIALDVLLAHYPQITLDPARPPEFRGWEFRAPRNLDVVLG